MMEETSNSLETNLYVCNNAGRLGNVCGACQHSVPHKLVNLGGEPCTTLSYCKGPENGNKDGKEVEVECACHKV